MAIKIKPHGYQVTAINSILKQKAVGLFLDMGLGKTVSALLAVDKLINNFKIGHVLIIAPPLVAQKTWSAEVAKWEQTKHLTYKVLSGNQKPAARAELLKQPTDLTIISSSLLVWLIDEVGAIGWPFDMIIIDEASQFKNPKAKKVEALIRVRALTKKIVLLTGTPAPNGLIDIWTLIYLLDGGRRLSNNFYHFRRRYFSPAATSGKHVLSWSISKADERLIYDKIKDITISMKKEDYLKMPPLVFNDIVVSLTSKERALLDTFEREAILEFEAGDITAKNAAALAGKLLQMSNGAVYNENMDVQPIHSKKLEALKEIIDEANGQSVLVFYAYKHDRLMVERYLKQHKIKTDHVKNKGAIERWNKGKTGVLLAHPASAGHGLNLQDGGHIGVWFGLTWNLEHWEQAIARLYRQGQKHMTIFHVIMTEKSFDQKVIAKLKKKALTQDALMQAVKAKIKEVHT